LTTFIDSEFYNSNIRPRAEAKASAGVFHLSIMHQLTSDKLFSAGLKIERAKQHIADLDVARQAFFAAEPYRVGTKHDPQTRKLIYYVVSVEDVPTNILLITGDVIQNLRSALDHLAYQLHLTGTGKTTSKDLVYFPIGGTNATEYKSQRDGKVKGMRQDAIDAIDATEPYKGGKGHQLWVLSKLNNIDKHRLVLIAIGSAFRSIDLGAHASRSLQQLIRQAQQTIPDYPVPIPPTRHLFFKTDPMMCPLKAGNELFIDAPDAEVNEEMQFRFDISLSEPEIIEGKPLLETLHQLADLVGKIITAFEPLL